MAETKRRALGDDAIYFDHSALANRVVMEALSAIAERRQRREPVGFITVRPLSACLR